MGRAAGNAGVRERPGGLRSILPGFPGGGHRQVGWSVLPAEPGGHGVLARTGTVVNRVMVAAFVAAFASSVILVVLRWWAERTTRPRKEEPTRRGLDDYEIHRKWGLRK
jgi:hypothetical protein